MSVVPKEERRRAILQFLKDTSLSLPPMAIFINMEPTFSHPTLKRLLYEMQDEGLVETIEAQGNYYFITEEGRNYLQESGNQ